MTNQKIIYLITIIVYLYISFIPAYTLAWEGGAQTNIKAHIQEVANIRLFGYTGPNTIVQVDGIRVFGQTSSDTKGYFVIDPLPISLEAKELCLTTIDSEKRSGFPLCISIPNFDFDTIGEIGPIYLPPTLSLTAGSVLQKGKMEARGVTIPNTKVIVSIFENSAGTRTSKISSFLLGNFIPTVYGAEMPFITVNSDLRGYFTINLPTDNVSTYRIFAKAIYKAIPTPKSQTLTFYIDSLMQYWIAFIIPKLILFIILTGMIYFVIKKEMKDKTGKILFAEFTETKLKPFAVRKRLELRRIWYNLRDWWRSSRI